MWEILNVLRRIGRGENKAAVARVTGHRRKTIRRYVTTAVELGWRPGLEEATEQLAVEVFRRLRPVYLRGRGQQDQPMNRTVRICLTCLLVASGTLLAGPVSAQTDVYDPLAVSDKRGLEELELILHDTDRQRAIPVLVYFPPQESPAPVVLFSHGLGGSRHGTRTWGSTGRRARAGTVLNERSATWRFRGCS